MEKLLYILRAIDGEVPETFQLLPYGKIEIEGEPDAFLDDQGIQAIINKFERRGNDMVIDYEHQTLKDVQAPASGWIKELVNKGKEGLWVVVEWTDKAKEYIAGKEYKYFSPVFWVRKSDRKVVTVEHVALTNYPKVNNLQPIIAKMTSDRQKNETGKHQEEAKMLEKLRKLLGLAEHAGEEKVTGAIEAIVAKNKELLDAAENPAEVIACKEVLEALKVNDDADKDSVIAAISGMGATDNVAAELSQEVAKLRTEMSQMKQGDLVAMALKEGKTSPDELDKWGRDLALKNPDQFRLIVLSRPAGSVIPIDEVRISNDDAHKDIPDDVQASVNKMMGVDDETWKKYGPREQVEGRR